MKGMIQVIKETRWKVDLSWGFGSSVLLLALLAYIWECQWLRLLEEAVKSLLSIYGGLLGVSIAAYALLISTPHLRKLMNRTVDGQQFSLYSKIHAQFTMYLLLQVFTLLGAFVASMIIGASNPPSTGNYCIDQGLNVLALFVLLFSLIYQMFLIKDSFMIIYNGAIFEETSSQAD